MLFQCAWRADWLYAAPRVRLLRGDAHRLPFADNQFDRVFHVGGINGYRDPKLGLAEMARVARPRTPIVVVDEELDPERKHSLRHRLAFRAITWFDPDPRVPVDRLPAGTECVEVSRVCRFYYCLTFQKLRTGRTRS
jgi:ubiquinone/menaquinone biosynthesis C-methylase UbiE